MSAAQQPATFQVAGSSPSTDDDRAGVHRHIRASKACFAARLGFQVKEIHVEARPGNVMVGEGEGGGLDGRHQPPGRRVDIYYNFDYFSINAASSVINAADCHGWGLEFNPLQRQLFAGLEYVQRHMNLYIWCMYLVYT